MNIAGRKISKKLKGRIIGAVLLLAALFGVIYWNYGRSSDEISYRTERAVRSDLRSVIQATGTLDAVETVDVGTQISGTVREIYIDYNSVVKKDRSLLR